MLGFTPLIFKSQECFEVLREEKGTYQDLEQLLLNIQYRGVKFNIYTSGLGYKFKEIFTSPECSFSARFKSRRNLLKCIEIYQVILRCMINMASHNQMDYEIANFLINPPSLK